MISLILFIICIEYNYKYANNLILNNNPDLHNIKSTKCLNQSYQK